MFFLFEEVQGRGGGENVKEEFPCRYLNVLLQYRACLSITTLNLGGRHACFAPHFELMEED